MHTSAAATNYDTAGYTEQHTDEAAPPNHSNAGPHSNSQPANHDFTNSIPDALQRQKHEKQRLARPGRFQCSFLQIRLALAIGKHLATGTRLTQLLSLATN
jgi:hypothetical protein